MIWYDVEQNTAQWSQLRLGIPCSSEFDQIITPKTLKLSSQSRTLMYRKLAEWVTGAPCENEKTEWMIRGSEFEDAARKAYSLLMDTEVTRGGFFTTDDGMLGASPDGLIGDNGDIELKAPLIQTQIRYALTGAIDSDYMTQIQGRLMIHGREWVDIFSYHPLLMIPPVRVYRDEKFIAALAAALSAFVEEMLSKREELERRFGPFVRPEPVAPSDDFGAFGVSDADVEMILAAQRAAQQASPSTGDI